MMKKSNRMIVYVVAITLITVIASIGSIIFKTTHKPEYILSDIIDVEDVTVLKVFYQPDFVNFEVTDQHKINDLLDRLGNCKVHQQVDGEESTGYMYSIKFLREDKEIMTVLLGESIIIKGITYTINEGELETNSVMQYIDKMYDEEMYADEK
jgi:hypothetical protein